MDRHKEDAIKHRTVWPCVRADFAYINEIVRQINEEPLQRYRKTRVSQGGATQASKPLDELGFVFGRSNGQYYWCRMYFGEPWTFYRHPDKMWVSLRPVTQLEIWAAANHKVDAETEQRLHDEDPTQCFNTLKKDKDGHQ